MDAAPEPRRSRCTGHCCRCFTIPYSPEELAAVLEHVRAIAAWVDAPIDQRGDPPVQPGAVPVDIEIIQPMLVHLGKHVGPPVPLATTRGGWTIPVHW